MPYVEQPAAAMSGKKSMNKNIRMTPLVAKTIDDAAASVGLDVTAFITSVAYQEAQRIKAEHAKTALPNDIFAAFAEAVTSEGKPNKRLAALARQKSERMADE
ncbi:DUF1778 domain-containing protein [Tropicibacter sp. Alg240-R139]|uniref:type II toxin-antitoxin system TacA family antitoxin n=1 Tax=Tropicibacter sp. Alg240-R139 TaxID=2305991 RepID=UPI0013E095A1|nr:DUF1778 domain-containing protein [Tropicibacter sp. Alg240-R139]